MVLRLSAVAAKFSDHLRQWDKQDCLGFSACSLLVLEKSSSRLRYHDERSSHANHFGSVGLNFTLRILCASSACVAHGSSSWGLERIVSSWKVYQSVPSSRATPCLENPELPILST